MPGLLEDRKNCRADPGSEASRTVLAEKDRPETGRELSFRWRRAWANPKEAGTLRERLSKPVGGRGTYGNSENKKQTARYWLSKAVVWGEVGKKQRPKNNPKLVRSEST